MRGPQALMASAATFAASWRDSNCTVRVDDHRKQKNIKIKTVEIRLEVFLKFVLPATTASDSASHARMALASSSAKRRPA